MAKSSAPGYSIMRLLVTIAVVGAAWALLVGPSELKTMFVYGPPLKAGNIKQARAVFDRELRSRASDPDAYLEIAAACIEYKQPDMEREYLERSLLPCKDAPRSERAKLYFHLSAAYLRIETTKPQQQAILAAQRAVELDPKSPDYLNQYGYLLADNAENGSELQEAVLRTSQALQLLKKIWPNTVEIRAATAETEDSYGWALYKQGYYDRAVDALNQAIADYPSEEIANPEATREALGVIYYHLGAAFRRQQHPDVARQALQTALSYTPNNKDAKDELEGLKADTPAPAAPEAGSKPGQSPSSTGAPSPKITLPRTPAPTGSGTAPPATKPPVPAPVKPAPQGQGDGTAAGTPRAQDTGKRL